LDAKSLKDDQTSGISSTVAAVNGSDVLAVRFFGSGPATKPDGTIVDCAGFPISEPASPSVIEQDRGWSIYYVAVAPDGVPELRCRIKKDGASTWSSHAIARGIESFQVLYGFNSDGDRIPNQYMTATAVTAKDGSLTPAELNAKTAWKKISGIKVALLISGSQNARSEQPASLYCLFGDTGKKPDGTLDCLNYDYASDAGTKITESSLASANRTRRVFNATILFRNPIEGNAK
jgi:type IV pilus assembly protein PilW